MKQILDPANDWFFTTGLDDWRGDSGRLEMFFEIEWQSDHHNALTKDQQHEVNEAARNTRRNFSSLLTSMIHFDPFLTPPSRLGSGPTMSFLWIWQLVLHALAPAG